MAPPRDPIELSTQDDVDLYDVATWEPRTILDRTITRLYGVLSIGARGIIVFIAAFLIIALVFSPAVLILDEPIISVFFLLSVVPALLLAAYIWYADITSNEPLPLLVGTFLLAIVFAGVAGVINGIGNRALTPIPLVGTILFFYLIVGPVEEAAKLLAVRVFAYRSPSFSAVIDGAVYGAVAGLGFATIENMLYITGFVTRVTTMEFYTAVTGITSIRALVGPGHVIYSAIAGYYLGLAKFNPQYAGPLVIKGLLIAAFLHATYNTTVTVIPHVIADRYPISLELAFVGYVFVFVSIVGWYLYRKIANYRRTYRRHGPATRDEQLVSEMTEFDPPLRRQD